MRPILHLLGRAFQITALIAMPSAIWVGHFGHDERGAITIFLSSILIFFLGFLLTQWTSRL